MKKRNNECNEKATVDTLDYNAISFSNYTEENPVRYLQENEFGKFDSVYSSFAVKVNEGLETVEILADGIVGSYKEK